MQQPVRTNCLGEEAVVVLLVGADGAARMDLALVHEALLRAHQELIETRGTVSRAWTQPPAPRTSDTWRSWPSGQRGKASPPSDGGPGLSMAVDGSDQKPPRFWKTGIPHAQLGLCMARLKQSNDD